MAAKYWAGGLLVVGFAGIAGAAYASTWASLYFNGGDARLYTGDGDWAPSLWKGECGQSNTMMAGVASTNAGSCGLFGCTVEATEAILCSSPPSTVFQGSGYTLNFYNRDDRRDTTWGDWAYGMYKGECASTDVMTGLAQYGQDGPQTAMARCSPMAGNLGAQNCSVLNFSYGDARETTSRGDWAYGYHKGECGLGRYVKGVAVGTSESCAGDAPACDGRRSLAILCCSPTF